MTQLVGQKADPGTASVPASLKRHGDNALVFAEDVKASEAVPGSTDNDTDSWRGFHVRRAEVMQESVRDVHEHLAEITRLSHGSAFVDLAANDRSANAGWSTTGAQGGVFSATHASYMFPSADESGTVMFAPGADTDIVPMLVTPVGIETEQFRIQHKRGGAVIATYPSDGQHWEYAYIDSVTLRYYRLEADISDAVITVGARRGDVFQLQKTSQTTSLVVPLGSLGGDVAALLEQAAHQDEALRSELQDIEHQTSRIHIARVTSPWAATEDNADGLRLGKAFIVPAATATTFYLNSLNWNLWTVATKWTIGPGEFDNNIVGFIAKNDSTWRNVRVVVRDRAGTIVASYSPEIGRTAPQAAYDHISNVPQALGDYTIRYMTTPDGVPALLPVIGFDYTLTVEERTDDDVPKWDGELGDGVTTENSLSDEVLERIDRHETAQGRVEISTDPDPVLVGGPTPVEAEEDIPQDAALAHAIRIGNISGLHRALQVTMNVDMFLQRGDQARTTGWMNAVELYVEVTNKPRSRTRLLRQPLTLANFLTQFDAAGAATYSGTADYTHAISLDLDVSGWDIDEDDLVTLRVMAFGVQGSAHVRVVFRNTVIVYDELASSIRQVPESPASGQRQGKALKFSGDEVGWHPAIGEHEELASRSSLTGGWIIPTPNRFGGSGSITQSGGVLRIDARAALRSGTYGVIVSINNTAGTQKTFIPWSAFRTGDGTYVTGGGHGTQGIPVGYWNANNNSLVVATADWAADNGVFELTLSGGTISGVANLRVWSAQ